MPIPLTAPARTVVAVDIGASTIKFCAVSAEGELLERPHQRATPHPCWPATLVSVVGRRVARGAAVKVAVGFPGVMEEGRVLDPGNLARPGGVTTAVDPELARAWREFPLQAELIRATGRDVRVVNDATLAALGCQREPGTSLVIALGTGFGLALLVDGDRVAVRDVGEEQFEGGRTYDEALGESARARDPDEWFATLDRAVARLVREFAATTVHLAGGNARRVSPRRFASLHCAVVVEGNEAPLRGAARLFYP
jgi:polyphosphate glucokinase